MRLQIYAVCWVYVYKCTAYAEDTLTNSGFFGLSKAYAEHTHTNLRRMLSIRVQIQGLCWGYAYKYNAYTERAHTNLCRMLSMRLQNQNVCWVYACNVEWQKDYLADVWGHVRSTLIYFIAEGGVDQQAYLKIICQRIKSIEVNWIGSSTQFRRTSCQTLEFRILNAEFPNQELLDHVIFNL